MFHFILPRPDCSVFHVAIGATDLAAAFDQFQLLWWRPELTGAIGVWQNHALVARVLPICNPQTGELECFLQEIKP
jgi:hypothetical protein